MLNASLLGPGFRRAQNGYRKVYDHCVCIARTATATVGAGKPTGAETTSPATTSASNMPTSSSSYGNTATLTIPTVSSTR